MGLIGFHLESRVVKMTGPEERYDLVSDISQGVLAYQILLSLKKINFVYNTTTRNEIP